MPWGATRPHGKTDHIIYDTKSGKLYFDADSKGGAAAILFATLSNRPMLDAGDFLIV